MNTGKSQPCYTHPRLLKLWSLWFFSVMAWAVQLFSTYSVVEWYCVNQAVVSQMKVQAIIATITIFCFCTVMLLALYAYRTARGLRRGASSFRRNSFMVWGAVFLSAFLGLTIVMQAVPNFVLPLCNGAN